MNWRWIALLVLLLIVTVFSVQNYQVVTIKFLVWSISTSRAIVIFTTLIMGILIGWLSIHIHKSNTKK